ncbi:PREDICTED: GDSL esterase/lipase 1 [Theobroma cacao]|uniref:GDSL esterase/lipase 1 n=1 Tax=Theobroma cacao TaxID=3641 RepID=A0AB32VIL0_THECC|nr:PREDICTED: GDSL esterase/lipase 1 [Theobroma cacao]
MASLKVQICCLLAYATFLSQMISCQSLPKEHVALFTLGDSLFDPGNNNNINTTNDYRANFWPYGRTFFGYPTGRFSDGRLIQDFIAEYAGLPLIPAFLQSGNHRFIYGVNFASGGAGALVETHQGLVIDLKTQVIYFKKVEKSLRQEVGDAEAKRLLSRAVYLISIGANEYLSRNSSISDEGYVAMVMGNLTLALKEIYKIGGRKFGFPGMAPLGCSPFLRSQAGGNGSCFEEVNKISQLHQRELPKTLKKLEEQLPGFKYSVYNFYKTISERLNNPSKYGFKDATTACCGSGVYRGTYSCGGKRGIKEYELCENSSENFFFDSYHPSEKAFQQFAQEMWSGGSDVISPYNIKQLFEA